VPAPGERSQRPPAAAAVAARGRARDLSLWVEGAVAADDILDGFNGVKVGGVIVVQPDVMAASGVIRVVDATVTPCYLQDCAGGHACPPGQGIDSKRIWRAR
jgi:hypothetical protein